MTDEEIAAIRKLSGRFQGSVKEEIDAYHAAGDNWALKSMAVLDLLSIALNALEAATTSQAEVRREAYIAGQERMKQRCRENIRKFIDRCSDDFAAMLCNPYYEIDGFELEPAPQP
jgi:hypothetical protein